MNRARLVQMAKIALPALMVSGGACLADDTSFAETVTSIVSTNMLVTWEGEYGFREAAPLNGADTNLCLCLYGSESAEGVLLEVYGREADSVLKILSADVDVKGVTPVVIQFGAFTNRTPRCYWSRWRHPGNGGNAAYVIYEMTNGLLSVSANYEYCDMGAGKCWHLVDVDDNYIATNDVPTAGSVVMWTNTNTIYSVANP